MDLEQRVAELERRTTRYRNAVAGLLVGVFVFAVVGASTYDGVILGHRVTIHSSSVIGADGFGYRLVEGRHQRIPHFGTVRIEDDVEIGASTTIDRAMVG